MWWDYYIFLDLSLFLLLDITQRSLGTGVRLGLKLNFVNYQIGGNYKAHIYPRTKISVSALICVAWHAQFSCAYLNVCDAACTNKCSR